MRIFSHLTARRIRAIKNRTAIRDQIIGLGGAAAATKLQAERVGDGSMLYAEVDLEAWAPRPTDPEGGRCRNQLAGAAQASSIRPIKDAASHIALEA